MAEGVVRRSNDERRWVLYRDSVGKRHGDWLVAGVGWPVVPSEYREVVEVVPIEEVVERLEKIARTKFADPSSERAVLYAVNKLKAEFKAEAPLTNGLESTDDD